MLIESGQVTVQPPKEHEPKKKLDLSSRMISEPIFATLKQLPDSPKHIDPILLDDRTLASSHSMPRLQKKKKKEKRQEGAESKLIDKFAMYLEEKYSKEASGDELPALFKQGAKSVPRAKLQSLDERDFTKKMVNLLAVKRNLKLLHDFATHNAYSSTFNASAKETQTIGNLRGQLHKRRLNLDLEMNQENPQGPDEKLMSTTNIKVHFAGGISQKSEDA